MQVNGAWEVKPGRTICRWMLAWVNLDQRSFCGAAAGYAGGGSFQFERFYARCSDDGQLISLLIDLEDKVTGRQIDFYNDAPIESRQPCFDCGEVIRSWHDEDAWDDGDQLVLLSDREAELHREGSLLMLSEGSLLHAKQILMALGITAAPAG